MMENKRYEYRTPVQIIIDRMLVKGEPSVTVKGFIREISASGCRIESPVPLQTEQEIMISFVLHSGHTILNARVKVIRVVEQKKGHCLVACQFIDLPEIEQFKVREFIVWREAEGHLES
jgi:hypothetical protein